MPVQQPVPSSGTKTTLTLEVPVTFQNTEYRTLTLRRPKLKDARHLADIDKDAVGAQARYFANLAEVPPGVIEELDQVDFAVVKAWAESFTVDIEKKLQAGKSTQ